jgi:hypothetical protein
MVNVPLWVESGRFGDESSVSDKKKPGRIAPAGLPDPESNRRIR